MSRLSLYQRIVRNAKRETGVSLSAEEASILADDDAIWMVADNDDQADELDRQAKREAKREAREARDREALARDQLQREESKERIRRRRLREGEA